MLGWNALWRRMMPLPKLGNVREDVVQFQFVFKRLSAVRAFALPDAHTACVCSRQRGLVPLRSYIKSRIGRFFIRQFEM